MRLGEKHRLNLDKVLTLLLLQDYFGSPGSPVSRIDLKLCRLTLSNVLVTLGVLADA